jgi:hypothetical protein
MKKLLIPLLIFIPIVASAQLRTLTVPQGGTGASTLTGCLTGNGTGAITGTGSPCGSGGGGSGNVATSSAETSGYFPTWSSTSATPATLAGTSQLFQNGSSIGIGSTTPSHTLTIASTTSSQLTLSAGTGINQWAFRNAGGNFYLSTTTVAGTATTTSSALSILNSTGRVGIGTAIPVATLHLVTQAATREAVMKGSVADSPNDAFYVGNLTSLSGSFVPAFAGFVDTLAIRPSLNFQGLVTAANDGANSSDFGLVDFAAMRTTSTSDPMNGSLSAVVNRRLFTFRNGDGTTNSDYKMVIMPSGNTGIASTSPWGLLSVNANALTAGVPQFVVGSSTATNFIVANNGNVGIGTTNPGVALDVNGNINSNEFIGLTQVNRFLKVSAYSNGTTRNALGSDSSIANGTKIALVLGAANEYSRIDLRTAGDVIFSQTGKVGISTTTPAEALHIVGSLRISKSDGTQPFTTWGQGIAGLSGTITANNSSSAGNYVVSAEAIAQRYLDGNSSWLTSPSGTAGNPISWTERMRLSNTGGLSLGSTYVGTNPGGGSLILSGNLGIGTSTPVGRLHVDGGTSATTTTSFGKIGDATSKSCFNAKNTSGDGISFYFVGTSMVVENNLCR